MQLVVATPGRLAARASRRFPPRVRSLAKFAGCVALTTARRGVSPPSGLSTLKEMSSWRVSLALSSARTLASIGAPYAP